MCAGIKQESDSFTRGELAGGVLLLNPLRSTALAQLVFEELQSVGHLNWFYQIRLVP